VAWSWGANCGIGTVQLVCGVLKRAEAMSESEIAETTPARRANGKGVSGDQVGSMAFRTEAGRSDTGQARRTCRICGRGRREESAESMSLLVLDFDFACILYQEKKRLVPRMLRIRLPDQDT
jgi:hypothetical protein